MKKYIVIYSLIFLQVGFLSLVSAQNTTKFDEAFYNEISKDIEEGKNEIAIEKLKKSLETKPNFVDYYQLARAYFNSQNMEEAESAINNAINIDPKNSTAYLFRGKVVFFYERI